MNKSMKSAIILAFCISVFPWAVVSPAESYFSEDFDSQTFNPSLSDFSADFVVENGVIHKKTSTPNDRRYVRTVVSDYNTRNFMMELTVHTSSVNTLAFVGIGSDDPFEPREAIYFRIHSPPLASGGVDVAASGLGSFGIGNISTTGPHRIRITKKRNEITFALDARFDGDFVADMSKTIIDLDIRATYLTEATSRLFFGAASVQVRFDDLVITELDVAPLDCNENEVDDLEDIESGTSPDVNLDGVPDECVKAYFSANFDPEVRNPSLENYGLHFNQAAGVVRRSSSEGSNDWRFVRTAVSDYLDRDFVFEVTFSVSAQLPGSLSYIGFGQAVAERNSEPRDSIMFRIHSPMVAGGGVDLSIAGVAQFGIGTLPSPGPHRARIQKVGDDMTFSMDTDFDGEFEADFSHEVSSITPKVAAYLNDRNSRLYLASAWPQDSYDSISVYERIMPIRRGDCNGDRIVDISDGIFNLNFLFSDAPAGGCAEACNTNNDDKNDISDAVTVFNFLFGDGPPPAPPFPDCGEDPEPAASLGCDRFACE